MAKENECCTGEHKHGGNHNASGAVYGLGFIGAAVYFIGHSESFWMGVLGFIKALVWPAIVVFKALEMIYK